VAGDGSRGKGTLRVVAASACVVVATGLLGGGAQAATPTVTEFASGMPSAALAHDITASPDGRVWFTTQSNNTLTAADMSGNIAVPTDIDEIGQPFGITAGSDGLLYYALAHPSTPEPGFNFVGAANPASGLANEAWFGGGDRSQPQYLTTAPDGLIRLTSGGGAGDPNASSIAKVQLATIHSPPSGHALVARAFTPTTSAVPQKITAGPSDTSANPSPALWFTEFATGKIGRVTEVSAGGPPSDFVEEFALLPANGPEDIELGPDGNLWVTMFGQNKVARVTPPTTFGGIPTVTTFDLPAGGNNILGIAAGPDNNMWIAQESGNKIIRMNLSGQVTGEFAVNAPRFITTGADGNLWFTANSGPRVARITTELDPPEHRNTAPIDIPITTVGQAFPSSSSAVEVTDEPGVITDVNVRVTGISHNFPDDLDLILQPPNGEQAIMLASDAGSAVGSKVSPASAKQSYPAHGVTLGFDDASPFSLRDRMPLVSGIYKPTNVADAVSGDIDGGFAAAPSSFTSSLASLQGSDPNGTWRLWAFDDDTDGKDQIGKVFGGWGLDITTALEPTELTVARAGGGTGTVTSAPAGIDCGGTCSSLFEADTSVTLTASPGAGSTLALWSGCDSTSGNQCTLAMDSDRLVTVTFERTGGNVVPPPTATGQRAAALKKCKKIKKKKAKKKCKAKANRLPL
jgi:streptogramin lyase/subtilisin-like proprotein convertase family protein